MEPDVPAQKLLGPYQLGLLLGEGGMGEVYKAFDDRLGRWVAVKRVRGGGGEKEKKRLRREARTLAQLGHPGIVQIFDWVQDEDGDWIVMELIDGPTLAELRRAGPLLPALAVEYGRQIASALAAAHAKGVVHRDLKTENVMVLPSGHVKVLDFGLARRFQTFSGLTSDGGLEASVTSDVTMESDSSRSSRVQPVLIVGTPRAMSPEQAMGHELDARSDLFSLGVLLYEISTARSPFKGRTLQETLSRVMTHSPPSIQRLNPSVPPGFSQLVDLLLEKEAKHRLQNAAVVEEALLSVLEGAPHRRVSKPQNLPLQSPVPEDSADPEADHDTVVVKTLLLSDLVGSTQLVEQLGDRQAAVLFQRHDRVARDLLQEHGGREIDKTDGFLLLFDRPWSAVAYALAYHRVLQDLELEARVGIHLGEVVLYRNSDDDVQRGAKLLEVEGLAKPTAARLMSLAMGGQTLLTRAAYEVARRSSREGSEEEDGEPYLQWPRHGRYRFQGMADAMEVFEVGSPGVAPLLRPTDSVKAQRVEPSPSLDARLAAARADLQPQALLPDEPTKAAVILRAWPPPELPEQPYPVLLPYSHPDLLAGRDGEMADLWRMLEMQVPILGLSAPSGTGKSSLLLGGLVPLLRAAGVPVAVTRHPTEAGLAACLIGDLLEGADLPADHDARAFVDRLVEVEGLAGTAPVLVLDQFEDILRPGAKAARVVLGLLMASSLARRPGRATPPCRWLIAYRREYFGQLRVWLGDVLRDARSADMTVVGFLPHDLSGPERFHRLALTPLGTPLPGVEDPAQASTEILLAAIETPLAAGDSGESARFPWFFAAGHSQRLAQAFAEARQAQPEAPLAPELQVVLAHLLAQAAPDGCLRVPEDAGALIDQALDEHLRRALEGAFPADSTDSSTRRARALLALRELATSTGRQQDGLSSEQLVQAIGMDGEAVLERLATPLTRLVWVRETAQGLRWTLSHDRLAEAVVRLVDEEGQQGRILIDRELLALRQFVTLRTELFRAGQEAASTRVSERRFRGIAKNAGALLWDDRRRSWFSACRARRRSDRLRFAVLGSAVLTVLVFIGLGGWSWAEKVAARRELLDQVTKAEPEEAFQALYQLSREPDLTDSELLTLLRQRADTMDVLEWGMGGLEEPTRSAAVLWLVETALPWLSDQPTDFVLIANMIWALDYSPGRDPALAERAQALRDEVLKPLRELRPPPPLPAPEDPDWIQVPAGSFLMGSTADQGPRESESPQHEVMVSSFRMLRHEVTLAQFRRLLPEYLRGIAEKPKGIDRIFPAAYMTWYEAYVYSAWLGGRLPTEAEWEYASRADCAFDHCDRDGKEAAVDQVAWTLRNSKNLLPTGEVAPERVKALEPNPWGFYDLLGNVSEWTADPYAAYPKGPQSDAWSPEPNSNARASRGGNYRARASRSRPGYRGRRSPGKRSELRGLRTVMPPRSAGHSSP